VTVAGFAPVMTLSEDRRANVTVLGHVAVLAIGATSGIQVANFTATALSVVCLLLVPAFLLMTHRGIDLVPLVLAALGWISFLASCLVNGVSVLWPNAVAPAAFGLGPALGEVLRAFARRRTLRAWLPGFVDPVDHLTFMRSLYLLVENDLVRFE